MHCLNNSIMHFKPKTHQDRGGKIKSFSTQMNALLVFAQYILILIILNALNTKI